jgi:glycosidase
MILVRIFLALILLITSLVSSISATASENESNQVGLQKEIIYFVMPDRYRNGDVSNDSLPGFDPANTAFFHGGDLKGLTGNCTNDDGLARIKALGFTAIWMTPLVVQQPPTEGGAGYHGYWGVDFLNVDPHLGSNQDLQDLSICAKKLGLKLILDVVTNHTGDIIWYQDRKPYIAEKFKDIKNPGWLNDINNYHNTGDMNSCWSGGSCMRDGDFYGLDDLATEKPEVYMGWADVYSSWISRFGFQGFRVDTARHVDEDFFKNWSPLINKNADASGIPNFTIFGEVWEQNPTDLMRYMRINKIQTALDFPFQRVAVEYAASSSDAETLRNLFEYDDYYISSSSAPESLVTFLGNHDMGRAAFLIDSKKINPSSQLLQRVKLAHSLLYLSRGIPVVYYGDEVGMTGSGNGNDQRARQDMFATKVSMWKSEKRVGGKAVGDSDSFSQAENPISTYLRQLASLRSKFPALANGQMQIRYAKGPVFAFSKRAKGNSTEFVVILNNSGKTMKAIIPTSSNSSWMKIFGAGSWRSAKADIQVAIPPFETLVLKSTKAITETSVKIKSLKIKQDFLTGFFSISAPVETRDMAYTEFYIQNGNEWNLLGKDLNSPFTYYMNPEDYSGKVTVKAITTNSKGGVYAFKPISFSIATS